MLSATHLLVALMPSGSLRVRNIVELAALRTPSDSPSATLYPDVYLSADGYIKALGLMLCPTTTTSLTPCAGMRMLPPLHKDTSIGPLSVKCSALVRLTRHLKNGTTWPGTTHSRIIWTIELCTSTHFVLYQTTNSAYLVTAVSTTYTVRPFPLNADSFNLALIIFVRLQLVFLELPPVYIGDLATRKVLSTPPNCRR